MTFLEIQSKINNAHQLDFGNILDQSINMFKLVWLKGFLMVLILVIFTLSLTLLLSAIGIGSDPYVFDSDNSFNWFSTFSSTSIIDSLPQSILISITSIGLLAGFYRICKQEELDSVQKDDLFFFFKGVYFSKLCVIGIIYSLIAVIAQAMFFIPYIYAFVPLSFFAVVFSNNSDLNETEIVKICFNLGTRKWFLTFGLLLVTGILGMLGIIACGIGVLFTISIMYLPIYFIYRDVIGFNDESEIDQIGSDLVDF